MNLLFAESYDENHSLDAKSNDNMKKKVCCNLRLIKFQFLKMRPILAGSLASHTRPGEKRKENSAFSTFIIQNIASIKVIEARYSIQTCNMGPD